MSTTLLSFVLGCQTDPTGKDGPPSPLPVPTVPTLPTEPEPGPPDCAPPLSITPAGAAVDPLDLVQLVAAGGTGEYVFEVTGAGTVSPFGTYLAPAEPTTDTVVLRDEGCEGEASATITVGQPFSIEPSVASVLPGTAFTFEAVGGSGSLGCAIRVAESGPVLTGCAYEAGPDAGTDRVTVTDLGTGEVLEATITVDPNASLRLWGEGGIAIPVDHPFVPRTSGGSGLLALTITDGDFRIMDGAIHADGPGSGTLEVRDRFAGFEIEVELEGIEAYVPPSTWFGTQTMQGRALALGDLDGDGFDDAAIGSPEINLAATGSGGAAVFRGSPTGLESTPAWQWSGLTVDQGAGRALAHADVDGDGTRDLLVGSDADDYGIVNVGTLQMFRGLPGGTFEPEPFALLRGVYSSDRLGSSVVVCDVDGDGVDDVAAGAWAHEDRSGLEYPNDTGAVMVFRGSRTPTGVEYPDSPTAIRYGNAWNGTDWTAFASSNMGFLGLAGGDIDGDGDCDLAVASPNDGAFGAPESYGFVQVFEGLPSLDGTLSARPVRQYANLTYSDGTFGRDLAMDDIDGDGLADLLAGSWLWDGPRGGNSGGAFLFLGASWDGRPGTDVVEPTEADWWVTGAQGTDYVGNDVSFADVDGDGTPDVVVGAPRGEASGGVANAGVVRVYSGVDILAGEPHDAVDDVPAYELGGLFAEEFFGQAASALGDTDADGEPDFLVLAGRSDLVGYDVQQLYVATPTAAPRLLQMPGGPAGHDHGRATHLVDLDGDGDQDLLVGSPNDVNVTKGTFSGGVYRFDQVGGTLDTTPTPFAGTWPEFGGGDRFGNDFATLDFDGDGTDDLATTARTDGRPTSFGTSYVNPTECAGSIGGSGSVQIWLGIGSGFATTPAFVFHGPDANANIRVIAGPFDHDGDGYDDLLVAGRDWQVEGGFSIVHGRPADDAGTTVICSDDTWFGSVSGEQFGQAAAVLPDLDGDGCDEAAVSANSSDQVLSNQGLVRVFWGYGSSCSSNAPHVTTLQVDLANVNIGEAMTSGDFDGDGRSDLGVTSIEWRIGATKLGNVLMVPGWWLDSLPSQETTVGVLPSVPVLSPLVPPDGQYGAPGPSSTARFGASVVAVHDDALGHDLLAVGMPDGDEGGVLLAGGVLMYRWTAAGADGLPGLDPIAFRVVGGETAKPGGGFGESLSAGRFGSDGALVVGAPLSMERGVNTGAAWVVDLGGR